jgi:pyruvate/2-oxoglutarate dehydrogenase complex dihydrolipoamide dehydrogenase (E3) component
MNKKFDAIIIGAGQAGPSLAGKFSEADKSVAFVERKLFGGTCVNTGCTLTKAMVASAYAAHLARRASDFGVEISGDITVDMRLVKRRKDRIVADSRNGLEKWIKGMKNCTVFEGHARFVSPKEISVGAEILTAERVFINVGGRAAVPKLEGLETIEYFTNSTLLDIDFVPEHLIIVGCCDISKNKHATKHFQATQHPIIKSFETNEDWGWCYVDELFFEPLPDLGK